MHELLPLLQWQSVALLAVAALLVGISKTALPGVVTLPVAIFAALLPAKASTAALLLLLIFGDFFAVYTYRRHTQWKMLLRLAPTVILGLLVGASFLAYSNDSGVQKVIGVLLIIIVLFALWQRKQLAAPATEGVLGKIYGVLGGFTTMVANAGGPVMSMYFMSVRLPVKEFLGTAAWFFAIINVSKLPISFALGLVTAPVAILGLLLFPLVAIGALLGKLAIKKMNQTVFDWLVIGFTLIGAGYLVVS